jgi:hypothetical protein
MTRKETGMYSLVNCTQYCTSTNIMSKIMSKNVLKMTNEYVSKSTEYKKSLINR